ncbi:7107_t:CDS:2, partial [Scutellospora calospora]
EYYIRLEEYQDNIFEGLFYFIHSNEITEDFMKDKCQRCNKLDYVAKYGEYYCDIKTECKKDPIFTMNGKNYQMHYHTLCFSLLEIYILISLQHLTFAIRQ